MRCPHCGGEIDGVVRWTEPNDDYARAVREDATVTRMDAEVVREPVNPDDKALHGEIGVTGG